MFLSSRKSSWGGEWLFFMPAIGQIPEAKQFYTTVTCLLCINYLGLYIYIYVLHLNTHFCKACKIDCQYNFMAFVYLVYSKTLCISGAVFLTFIMSVWNLSSQMCYFMCVIL